MGKEQEKRENGVKKKRMESSEEKDVMSAK